MPDDVVQLVSTAGTAEDCRKKVAEYIDAGATCPLNNEEEMIRAFSKSE
ncbi:MAG: hypothetical protein ACFFD4_13160 [Candidatus Odinarchaeota archaeon]